MPRSLFPLLAFAEQRHYGRLTFVRIALPLTVKTRGTNDSTNGDLEGAPLIAPAWSVTFKRDSVAPLIIDLSLEKATKLEPTIISKMAASFVS
ncbi:hypothetical protein AWB81_04791 [Caballeronia arationis]|uniref:hypothetical protein n=1 Tax=Caballeronia arationis TaxID=1777142 RepID=UPI00074B9FBA|nr:hypothetical protein [Caballeronia arationis]SAK90025.1 hypothetical protein AWB81_04791 [Caballeronia arationis]